MSRIPRRLRFRLITARFNSAGQFSPTKWTTLFAWYDQSAACATSKTISMFMHLPISPPCKAASRALGSRSSLCKRIGHHRPGFWPEWQVPRWCRIASRGDPRCRCWPAPPAPLWRYVHWRTRRQAVCLVSATACPAAMSKKPLAPVSRGNIGRSRQNRMEPRRNPRRSELQHAVIRRASATSSRPDGVACFRRGHRAQHGRVSMLSTLSMPTP